MSQLETFLRVFIVTDAMCVYNYMTVSATSRVFDYRQLAANK